MELRIARNGHGGYGIALRDGKVTFVQGALAGELVEARIYEEKRNCAKAVMTRVIEPSPQRVIPLCPVYAQCGGCSHMHMRYEAVMELLTASVADNLERIGGIKPGTYNLKPIMGMNDPYYYRNKAVFQSDGHRLGYMSAGTHDVVNVPYCALQSGIANGALTAMRAVLNNSPAPALKNLTVLSTDSGEGMAILDGATPEVARQLYDTTRASGHGLTSVWTGGALISGAQALTDTRMGMRVAVTPQSFRQVNPLQADKLYAAVLEAAGTGARCVDAYCGSGLLTLLLAGRFERVVGIEVIKQAIDNAQCNTEDNGVNNATFICDTVERALPRILSDGTRPDALILDPPRAGVAAPALDAIVNARVERIVYISCNPATLARDIKTLCTGGYALLSAQPVDMFPWTGHVETIVVMQRKDPS